MYFKHELKQFDKSFPLVAFEIKIELMVPHHWHKEIEILHVKEGHIEIVINSKKDILNPGDLLFIDRGQIHSFSALSSRNAVRIIQFDISMFESLLTEIADKKLSLISRCDSDKNIEVVNTLHSQLLNEFSMVFTKAREQNEFFKMSVKAGILKMYYLLLCSANLENYSNGELNRLTEVLKRLDKVSLYVDENIEGDVTLDGAAGQTNYSTFYFTRFFKKYTGLTFNEYVNIKRVQKAENMLCATSEAITSIAFQCGFNSIKTFNKVFMNIKKCSPTEFRKRLHK